MTSSRSFSVNWEKSEAYEAVMDRARWSHGNRRSIFHIEDDDVAWARLFAYAYRSQTIGAFHGCRAALNQIFQRDRASPQHSSRSLQLLKQLEDLSIVPVPDDFRALIFTLCAYDRWIEETLEVLEADCGEGHSEDIQPIRDRFVANMNRISDSNGIYVASDQVLPEQASFVVPKLGITIVSLIYGDHLSWNCAHLSSDAAGGTVHRHHQGVEIHLGFSPIHGRTILGGCATELREGYAMPIPCLTQHGFDNLSGHGHLVPFIFGSLKLGGWGVFFDVEPRPVKPEDLIDSPLESESMNHSIYLERILEQIAGESATGRKVLIPAKATFSRGTGGLELAVCRVAREGLRLTSDTYGILSVRQGSAIMQIGPATAPLDQYDHVGIPAGMEARIVAQGDAPLVTLDTRLLPA